MPKNMLNTRPKDRSDEPAISSRLLRSSCVFMTLPSNPALGWKAEGASELLRKTDYLDWAKQISGLLRSRYGTLRIRD